MGENRRMVGVVKYQVKFKNQFLSDIWLYKDVLEQGVFQFPSGVPSVDAGFRPARRI